MHEIRIQGIHLIIFVGLGGRYGINTIHRACNRYVAGYESKGNRQRNFQRRRIVAICEKRSMKVSDNNELHVDDTMVNIQTRHIKTMNLTL